MILLNFLNVFGFTKTKRFLTEVTQPAFFVTNFTKIQNKTYIFSNFQDILLFCLDRKSMWPDILTQLNWLEGSRPCHDNSFPNSYIYRLPVQQQPLLPYERQYSHQSHLWAITTKVQNAAIVNYPWKAFFRIKMMSNSVDSHSTIEL